MLIKKISELSKKQKKQEKVLTQILDKYESVSDPVVATCSFVKEVLNPNSDRYDMIYRYEHTLRVAHWGKTIAEGEGWDSNPLIIACLLHDVGYPFCEDMEALRNHAAISAEIAERYLKKINYTEDVDSICKAVALHSNWNDFPEGTTPFEISVRDADDMDRFDVMRLCLVSNSDIGERTSADIVMTCDKQISKFTDFLSRPCGTSTADKIWRDKMETRIKLYTELKMQMQNTAEMEKYLTVSL